MNHAEFDEQIDRFLEGKLNWIERARFESHEQECLACAKHLNDRLWDRVGDPNDLGVSTLTGPAPLDDPGRMKTSPPLQAQELGTDACGQFGAPTFVKPATNLPATEETQMPKRNTATPLSRSPTSRGTSGDSTKGRRLSGKTGPRTYSLSAGTQRSDGIKPQQGGKSPPSKSFAIVTIDSVQCEFSRCSGTVCVVGAIPPDVEGIDFGDNARCKLAKSERQYVVSGIDFAVLRAALYQCNKGTRQAHFVLK